MKNEIDFKVVKAAPSREIKHHAKCGLRFDAYNGDYDCEYAPIISCEGCKYGGFGGRKDPLAARNQPKVSK